ncbi:MAG TPA: Fic family protein [Candidatus Dojkabacteria bacterium]|jgi:Fic family protein
MIENYTINSTILNQIYHFSRLYERLYLVDPESGWFKEAIEISTHMSSFSAVTFDKKLLENKSLLRSEEAVREIFDQDLYKQYNSYKGVLKELEHKKSEEYSIEKIMAIHKEVMGVKSSGLRKNERTISKVVVQNDVYKTIELKVKSKPSIIRKDLKYFIEWLNSNSFQLNPIVAGGIAHIRLAQIHPFDDGNGRTARIFENLLLLNSGIEYYKLIPIEMYYLKNIEEYYDLIENSIAERDLTKWLEFYTEGLLSSINSSFDLIRKLSGNTIDLVNRKVVDLTEREIEVIDILNKSIQASGAEIANILKVTRQNINVILKRLEQKKVVEKIGQGTSSRYTLRK